MQSNVLLPLDGRVGLKTESALCLSLLTSPHLCGQFCARQGEAEDAICSRKFLCLYQCCPVRGVRGRSCQAFLPASCQLSSGPGSIAGPSRHQASACHSWAYLHLVLTMRWCIALLSGTQWGCRPMLVTCTGLVMQLARRWGAMQPPLRRPVLSRRALTTHALGPGVWQTQVETAPMPTLCLQAITRSLL